MATKEELDILLVGSMLKTIGDDPARVGLLGTPHRVVKMWKELFRGYDKSQSPIVTTFPNGSDGIEYDEMILDTGSFYSHCEHHMVPFFGKYYFAYIPHPKGRILGLSKVARVVGYHAARLQVQERLTQDILKHIETALQCEHPPHGIGLTLIGEHLCKTMRGVKISGKMQTTALCGNFKKEMSVKQEFFNSIKLL